MGHCISVYLMNKSELRDEKIKSIIDGKDTDDGLVMSKKIKSSDLIWTELESDIIATEHIPNIREYGKDKTIAKIETDYFGGWGVQSAKLFVNNKKVYDESDEQDISLKPINTALKMMGVTAKSNMDEFDTIGLSRYRSNSDFNK